MKKIINDKRLPVIYKKKNDCMGCYACYSICPVKAIKMEADNEGFDYPVINYDVCIRCYKCEEVCPTRRKD